MLTYAILATLLAAGAQAIAEPQITPPPSLKHRRDLFDDVRNAFNSGSSAFSSVAGDTEQLVKCIDLVEDVLDDHAPPSAEGDFGDAVTSHFVNNGNLCAESALAPSLASSWSAYESSLVSWYSTASGFIQSAADACPSLPVDVQNGFKRAFPCSTALEKAQLTAVAFDGQPTGAPTGSKTGNGIAAPRVTGIAAGAAAVAIGAAAVLL